MKRAGLLGTPGELLLKRVSPALIPLRITAGMPLQLDSSVAVDRGPEPLRGSIPVAIGLPR
jgi:hypothetical protein